MERGVLCLPRRRASAYFLSLTNCRNSQFLFLAPRMSSVGSASIAISPIQYHPSTYNPLQQMKQESRLPTKVLVNHLALHNPKRQSPTKNKILLGVTFSKQPSIRTLHSSIRAGAAYQRGLTHSTEEMHHSNSVQNAECPLGEREEMFSRSYARIQKMKSTIANKNIDQQLNDVLLLIKEEKTKIQKRIKFLESSNAYYRRVCEGTHAHKTDTSTNTEQLIGEGIEQEYCDRETQWEQLGKGAQRKSREAYCKLKTMLIQMSIKPSQILQQQGSEEEGSSTFRALSDAQIIKIQQFFIKKLAAKLPK